MKENSTGGIISIGNDDVDQNINIGTDGVRTIAIGTASGTNLTSGSGVMYGNFYGNTLQQISLDISASSSSAFHQTQSLTISPTSLVGVAPSQDLHYTWTAQLDEVIDASSDMTFNIHVGLSNEP